MGIVDPTHLQLQAEALSQVTDGLARLVVLGFEESLLPSWANADVNVEDLHKSVLKLQQSVQRSADEARRLAARNAE